MSNLTGTGPPPEREAATPARNRDGGANEKSNARAIPQAPPADKVFRERCEARAILVAEGEIDLRDAVDGLQQAAEAYGLIATLGQDGVQQMIADAFDRQEAAMHEPAANGSDYFDEAAFFKTCDDAREAYIKAEAERGSRRHHDHADHENGHHADHVPWTAPPMTWRDPATIPRRHFLYGHYYARGFVSATIADGGLGKSILKTAEVLSLITQLPILGITPTERVRALYWSGDDPRDEVERRFSAVCEHHNIDAKRLFEERWLFVGTRDEQPLIIGEIERGKVVINQGAVDDICAFITENNIGFAAFDPFKATHRIPENDNTNMDAIAEAFSLIAVRTGAAIAFDHHIRKPAAGQGEVTAADARGASALINKVRLSRVCNIMTPVLAQQARIPEDERRHYFRVDAGKMNIAPPGKASWFKIVPVPCANGQETPTVVPWKFPGVFDTVTTDHMHAVRAKAKEGHYRKDSRSEDWIGFAVAEVLNLDAEDEADRKQIFGVLKVWFQNGVLSAEKRNGANRHEAMFVVPGDWNEAAPVAKTD